MEINHGSESVLKVKLKFCRFSIAIYEKKKNVFGKQFENNKKCALVTWTSLYLMKVCILKINNTMAKNLEGRSFGRKKNKLLLNRQS